MNVFKLAVPQTVLNLCQGNIPLLLRSINIRNNGFTPPACLSQEMNKFPWAAKSEEEHGEKQLEAVCFRKIPILTTSPFTKIIFRNHHSETSLISPTDREKHKGFLDAYEHYQRDHRTTLNQALMNSPLVAKHRMTLFCAERLTQGSALLEFSSRPATVFADGGRESRAASILCLRIGGELQSLLLSQEARRIVATLTSVVDANPAVMKNLAGELADRLIECLDYAYAALSIKDDKRARDRNSVLSFASPLLYTDVTVAAERILLKEGLRLIQGVLVNLCYAETSGAEMLYIFVLNSGIDGRTKVTQTFLSYFGKSFIETPRTIIRDKTEMLGYAYWLHAMHCHSLPDPKAQSARTDDAFKIACASEYGPDIARGLAPTRDESDFKEAVAAAIRFATIYRPASVHEGREQQLSIIVGFSDEVRRLFRRVVNLAGTPEKGGGAGQVLDLSIPAVDTNANRDDRIIQARLSQARSKIKAFSNILDRPDYAIHIDAKPMGNGRNAQKCARNSYRYYRCSGIYAMGRGVENYKYPFAKSFYDIHNEPNMALIKVHGRTRIDLIYKGKPRAGWTDHSAMWKSAVGWNESTLANEISEKVCVDCEYRGKCADQKDLGTLQRDECRRALRRIVAVIYEIARSPHEGAAVVICYNKNFTLSGREKGSPQLQKLVDKIQNMADGDYEKLNYLRQIEYDDERDEGALKRLLTLDGGSIVNLANGNYWARRRFVCPSEFNLQNIYDGTPATLRAYWEEEVAGGGMRWPEWPIYREWGTRHQYSLALSATELIQRSEGADGAVSIKLNPEANPDYVVLVASSDGNITLMYNGSVISPEGKKAAVAGGI